MDFAVANIKCATTDAEEHFIPCYSFVAKAKSLVDAKVKFYLHFKINSQCWQQIHFHLQLLQNLDLFNPKF